MNGPLFIANLALTVALLLATILTGRSGRRNLHYAMAGGTIASLTCAIVQAEVYGRGFDFDALRLQVHLGCAFAALCPSRGVIWSGIGLALGKVQRKIHRRWVGLFVALTVLAVASAGFMFGNAERLA